jgi:hypothetical protein
MPRMGWHYTPCDGGGSGGGRAAFALVAIAALVLAAAIAGPAHHAAHAASHVLADVLEVVVIVLATVAGLAVTAILVAVAVRVWRWQARTARQRHELAAAAVPVEAPQWPHRPALGDGRPAIEAPRRVVPGVVLRRGEGVNRDRG